MQPDVEYEPLLVLETEREYESIGVSVYAVYLVTDPENPPPGIQGYDYGDFTPDPDEPTPSVDHYELWVAMSDNTNEPAIYAFESVDSAMEYAVELTQIIWEQGDLPEFAN